jgi:putative ABC transport system permease protein
MFKIAWRNILRNKRRSILSLSIIIIGVCVLYLFKGYISYTFNDIKNSTIAEYGNLEIAAVGYWDSKSEERPILAKTDLDKIKFLLSKNPVIKDCSSQLNVYGIIGNETKSTLIAGIGVETGKYQNRSVAVISGSFLSMQDTDKALLGKGVFDKFDAKQGDWLSIWTTDLNGDPNARNLQVSGTFSYGISDADNALIFLPLGFVQSLLNTDGVDRVVVHLTDDKFTAPTIAQLKEEFHNAGLKVEVKDWVALADYYRAVKGMLEPLFFVISLIIFILVFFSILEITSMAFLERMNEIGTIRAIGTTSFQIFSMLCQEGLILGVIGGMIGLGLGYGCGSLINTLRITYTPPGSGTIAVFNVILGVQNGILPFITVVVPIMISALYPALKAARLNIVNILRHV